VYVSNYKQGSTVLHMLQWSNRDTEHPLYPPNTRSEHQQVRKKERLNEWKNERMKEWKNEKKKDRNKGMKERNEWKKEWKKNGSPARKPTSRDLVSHFRLLWPWIQVIYRRWSGMMHERTEEWCCGFEFGEAGEADAAAIINEAKLDETRQRKWKQGKMKTKQTRQNKTRQSKCKVIWSRK